jgi:hypothetical protein
MVTCTNCIAAAAAAAAVCMSSGVGIANLIWGAARLGLQPSPQVSHLLLWQAQRGFSSMDLQLLSSCVWGVAKLRLRPGLHWLHKMARRVRRNAILCLPLMKRISCE